MDRVMRIVKDNEGAGRRDRIAFGYGCTAYSTGSLVLAVISCPSSRLIILSSACVSLIAYSPVFADQLS
ncbi:hypothetical protein EV127DRAFT_416857 [Xylaria flabelliformis]|nr:hypothetical protein EV127DRAFT_416857 [Xylaria flabelliformis]